MARIDDLATEYKWLSEDEKRLFKKMQRARKALVSARENATDSWTIARAETLFHELQAEVEEVRRKMNSLRTSLIRELVAARQIALMDAEKRLKGKPLLIEKTRILGEMAGLDTDAEVRKLLDQ